MEYDQIAYVAKYGGTVFFFVFFLVVLVYVLLPGGGKRAKEAADVVFQAEDKPIVDTLDTGNASMNKEAQS